MLLTQKLLPVIRQICGECFVLQKGNAAHRVRETVNNNINCNCIAPPTRRPRAHHRINPYIGARRQNETEMFSDHDETSPSITAVSGPSVACSMLAVQQQKKLCRQFVDVSAARRGCHTMKRAV